MRRVLATAVVLLLPAAPAAACPRDPEGGLAMPHARTTVAPGATGATGGTGTAGAPARARAPRLVVTTRVRGLSHAWDVKPIGGGELLITERNPARLTIADAGGRTRTVAFPTAKVFQEGETGLMGLALDQGFAKNRRFYTCSGWLTPGGGHDVRVNAWRLNADRTAATHRKTLLAGLPSTSGRHGGCRLLVTTGGAMVVGTGDAATGTNPRDLTSLGGKTLRLDPRTGRPWPTNPFVKAGNVRKRYVLTFGHRNVQGLAQRRDGTLWSVEHGPDRDDEVNKLVAGGDYGWNPVPGYDESVPMTDQGLPGRQVPARWRSGYPTLATSGSAFVHGTRWGSLDGALAVATLKAERMVFLRFDRAGRHPRVTVPAALRSYGRLRTATSLANGNLLVATDGEDGSGRILLVEPR